VLFRNVDGDPNTAKAKAPPTGMTLAEALRDRRFWTMMVAFIPISFALGGPIPNMENILKQGGMTPGQVMRVFMVQGSVIGAVGTLVGALLGVIAALNLSAWMAWFEQLSGQQVFAADLYVISSLPSQLQWADVALICAAGLSLSFLATLYPAWRAAQTEPAEALRYE